MSGAKARLAAGDLLIETLDHRRTLDDAMALSPHFGALTGADRAFARAMASAALRQLGRIDRGLSGFLARDLSTATPPARALLRVGAAQLWVMGTPAHAGVSETVAAAKQWPRARKAEGLLNAVLRKVAADRSAFDAAPLEAVWPDWLYRAFVDSLGAESARDLATAQMNAPQLHLTARSDASALAHRLGGDIIARRTVSLEMAAVESLPDYSAGEWWVQDAAAALPAELLNVGPNDEVLDLCAAPGGKTLQLAASKAQVIALDRSAKRLQRLRENLERTRLADRVQIETANAETWRPERLASYILLDAPCSAMGTLRRHPEGAWIKRPEEVGRYPQIQKRLLKAAIEMAAPGGLIVYCVCSPLRAEGRDVVDTVLAEGAVVSEPIRSEEVAGFETKLTERGDLLTTPEIGEDHDAFFISRLRVR